MVVMFAPEFAATLLERRRASLRPSTLAAVEKLLATGQPVLAAMDLLDDALAADDLTATETAAAIEIAERGGFLKSSPGYLNELRRRVIAA